MAIKYSLSIENPAQHLFRIEASFQVLPSQTIHLELSRWRPGRYENGDFPIKLADIASKKGNDHNLTRLNSHVWEATADSNGIINIDYLFYAAEKNAGSSYVDENLIYINFINLLIFYKEQLNEPCEIKVEIPKNFSIACSMSRKENLFFAKTWHELADSPLLSSNQLHHDSYDCEGVTFHLWFECKQRPDFEKIKKDFLAFTQAQIHLFGEFPVAEYHFLFLIIPQSFYHGVEHCASTVIVLGPDYYLTGNLYNHLLGISSHELFHAWNVKSLRPAEMVPYHYSGETYSKLHYITEGITTYYGDLILFRCGVWNQSTFLKEFHDSNALRFYANGGGDFTSLKQASFESWINGYKEGIPNRKISFYAKGALVAFMLDQEMLERSNNQFGLDNVMKEMYLEFGKTNKGFTEEEFWNCVEKLAGFSFTVFRKNFIDGTHPLEEALKTAADRIGWSWEKEPSAYPKGFAIWGLGLVPGNGKTVVANVLPNSPAEKAGMAKDDEIVAINGRKIENNLSELISFFAGSNSYTLHFFSQLNLKTAVLDSAPNSTFPLWSLTSKTMLNEVQMMNFKRWMAPSQ